MLPLNPLIIPNTPANEVQPFTHRDGLSLLKRLELMRRHIDLTVVPWVNESYKNLGDAVNAAIQAIISNSVEVQDEVINTIFADLESEIRKSLDKHYSRGVSVDAFGAVGDGVTDDTEAINAAIDSFGSEEEFGVVRFTAGKTYLTQGGHKVRRKKVIADNANIHHIGNNVCFDFNSVTDYFIMTEQGISGGRITGPSNAANAVAIRLGNSWGAYVINVEISDYELGRGIQLWNEYSATRGGQRWTEGSRIVGGRINNCGISIAFTNDSGTDSFGYTVLDGVALSIHQDQIGIALESSESKPVSLYNSRIDATIWLNGNNAKAITFNRGSRGFGNTYNVRGETGSGVSDINSVKTFVGDYGYLAGVGQVHITTGFVQASPRADSTFTNGAYAKIIPSESAGYSVDSINGLNVYPVAQYTVDQPHLGSIGFLEASGVGTPYTLAYVGSRAFRAYQLNQGETIADAVEVFAVDNLGNLLFGRGTTRKISQGSVPANTSGNNGDIHTADAGFFAKNAGRWKRIRPGVSGKHPFPTGRYQQAYGINGVSTSAFTSGNMRGVGFETSEDVTLTKIGLEVTTADAAGLIRLGIYRLNPDYTTELLIDAGTVSGATVGFVEATINLPVGAGELLIAVAVVQAGNPQVRTCTGSNPIFSSATPLSMTGNPMIGVGISGVTGALPGNMSVSGPVSYAPNILVRA